MDNLNQCMVTGTLPVGQAYIGLDDQQTLIK